ncbi:hypothetical protein E4U41_005616 [Claviceps citrina]|nr:hypothetical protein E4U41_005616 [Claviceps citrina]
MTFNPDSQASTPKETPRQESTIHLPAPASQPIVYSVSQHYNHSAHVARSAVPHSQHSQPCSQQVQSQTQRRSSEPPQTELSPVENILRTYGLDPATLTPSQLQLFRVADDSQKLRLLELWSICPPIKAEEIPALAWSSTSVDQEEQLARLRYQRQQNNTLSLDGTPVLQTAGGAWNRQNEAPDTEPYMSSGYEELMRREYERQSNNNKSRDVCSHFGSAIGGCHYSRAIDPVYKGYGLQAEQQAQLEMASQYGAFDQFRGTTMEVDVMDM